MNELTSPEHNRDLRPATAPERVPYAKYSVDSGVRPEAPAGGLLEYWRILQRRKGTVILIALAGALAGLLWTLPQAPVYQARTVLEIEGTNDDFMYGRDI